MLEPSLSPHPLRDFVLSTRHVSTQHAAVPTSRRHPITFCHCNCSFVDIVVVSVLCSSPPPTSAGCPFSSQRTHSLILCLCPLFVTLFTPLFCRLRRLSACLVLSLHRSVHSRKLVHYTTCCGGGGGGGAEHFEQHARRARFHQGLVL